MSAPAAPAPAPAPAPPPPSPWKRRLIVTGFYLLAIGCIAGDFVGARPAAEEAHLRVDREIKGLAPSNLEDQRRLLGEDFTAYHRQMTVRVVLWVGAAIWLFAATSLAAFWGAVERHRHPNA